MDRPGREWSGERSSRRRRLACCQSSLAWLCAEWKTLKRSDGARALTTTWKSPLESGLVMPRYNVYQRVNKSRSQKEKEKRSTRDGRFPDKPLYATRPFSPSTSTRSRRTARTVDGQQRLSAKLVNPYFFREGGVRLLGTVAGSSEQRDVRMEGRVWDRDGREGNAAGRLTMTMRKAQVTESEKRRRQTGGVQGHRKSAGLSRSRTLARARTQS